MESTKILGLIALVIFATQVIFSFYYASETVNQNIAYNQSATKIDLLLSINNQLKIKYSTISSIESLHQLTDPIKLIPVKKSLEINQ